MNKTELIGRLIKDAELKFLPGSGSAVTTFTLAVNRRFKKEGQQEADFIPVVVYGKTAEATANYTAKGSLVGVAGRIQTRNYEAKDGTRRYITEVVADEVEFLSKSNRNDSAEITNEFQNDITSIDDGEIPF